MCFFNPNIDKPTAAVTPTVKQMPTVNTELPKAQKLDTAEDATKKVKQEISQMGIPKALHQTVFNQVTGATVVKPQLIKKKIDALVSKGTVKREEADEMISKIESSRKVLSALASDYSDDLVQRSLDKWQAVSKKQRIAAVKQALNQTN